MPIFLLHSRLTLIQITKKPCLKSQELAQKF